MRQYGMTLLLCSMSLVGLLQERGYICGMMTITMMMVVVIGMMMKIKFLSGKKAIKNGRPRRQKLKKS